MKYKILAITGPMRSGKSEEINRLANREQIAGRKVQLFKPDRFRELEESTNISRDGREFECTVVPWQNPDYLKAFIDEDTDTVIIDEVQFFSDRIVDVIDELSDSGKFVIASGLDMDSDRMPFGSMPDVMAIADEVRKLDAVCEDCGIPAIYTYANFKKDKQVVVGDEQYNVLCKRCYLKRSED